MNLLGTRQKLVASNLANLDTPGYKTRDIDFQYELLSRIADGSKEENAPQVVEPDLPARNDGNNVNLDRETRMLAENSIRFQMASLMARGEIKRVRAAIEEGRNA
ncbi:MAG: flagellar biosynthesis protein FlgB [Bryobacterales bacterium]|nr:flagellar biosynthesis protein FlgB [Bryobacterales bacterium]